MIKKPNPAFCEQELLFGGSVWRKGEQGLWGALSRWDSVITILRGTGEAQLPLPQGSQEAYGEALQQESAANSLPAPTHC